MSSRRVTVLVAAFLIATGGLWWRFVSGPVSQSDRAVVRALSDLARKAAAPIALISEDEEVDRVVQASLPIADAPRVSIVPRTPEAIELAARGGTLLAGQRGREYLEVLGYELSSVAEDAESSFSLMRVKRRLRCAAVKGNAWSPLPGLEYTGRLGIVLPPTEGGVMMLVAGDGLPLTIDVVPVDGVPVRMSREMLPSAAAAPPDYWIEGRSPRDAPGHIQQLALHTTPDREHFVSVRLGRRGPRVLARLRGYPIDARATVCAAPTGADEAFRESTEFSVPLDSGAYFGTGWSDVMEAPDIGSARWMGAHAALLVPSARRGEVRVAVHVYRPAQYGDGEVLLRINDTIDLPGRPLRAGVQEYEWIVPASAWILGTNEVLLRVSGPGVERLLAISRVDLSLVP